MAPYHTRQLLTWTAPIVIALLSYLWYKKKRIGVQSDPGDANVEVDQRRSIVTRQQTPSLTIENQIIDKESSSPNKLFSRSLSGVDSAPIDIIIPRELRSSKSNPIVISDEDLDFEIEKIKSMKYGGSFKFKTDENNRNNNNNNNNNNKSSPSSSSMKGSGEISVVNMSCQSPQSPSPQKMQTQIFRTISPKKKQMITVIPPQSLPTPTTNSFVQFPTAKNNNSIQNDEIIIVDHEDLVNVLNVDKELKSEMNDDDDVIDSIEKIDLNGRNNTERDSANHSPVDVLLASPSLSIISDHHSERSSDSGKGGSDVVTPPPSQTPGDDDIVITTSDSDNNNNDCLSIYEFIIPQTLVGKLIGRHGCFVSLIKDRTKCHILVKKHPNSNKLKVCVIEGKPDEIDAALKLIRDRFPLKRFPDVTLEQVSFLPEVATVSLIPENLYLKLVEGVNNDTILSCMVTPNHLFLQQPAHPTFMSLNVLTNYMNACYSDNNSPLLPNPIPEFTICAAYSVDSWYRAIILSTDVESDTSYVKFLDYGGFAYVETPYLRQIRTDFMLLPFQAAECFLANIQPVGGCSWSPDAYKMIADVTKSGLIYTQIVDFSEDDVPLVYCYLNEGSRMMFLNEELVRRGYAEWIVDYNNAAANTLSADDSTEGAVGGLVVVA